MSHRRQRVKSGSKVQGTFRFMGKPLLVPEIDRQGRTDAATVRAVLGKHRGAEFVGKHQGRTVIGFHEGQNVGSLCYE